MPLTENEPVKDGFVKLMSKEKWNTYTASLKTEYDVLQLKSKLNAMQKLKDLWEDLFV